MNRSIRLDFVSRSDLRGNLIKNKVLKFLDFYFFKKIKVVPSEETKGKLARHASSLTQRKQRRRPFLPQFFPGSSESFAHRADRAEWKVFWPRFHIHPRLSIGTYFFLIFAFSFTRRM